MGVTILIFVIMVLVALATIFHKNLSAIIHYRSNKALEEAVQQVQAEHELQIGPHVSCTPGTPCQAQHVPLTQVERDLLDKFEEHHMLRKPGEGEWRTR